MSELSGKDEQVKNPERRKFLKTAGKFAVAGVGGAALGGIVANEVINKSEGGVITESGIFFPLYELHNKGIKAESIPDGLDIFFRETGSVTSTFSPNPETILRFTMSHSDKKVSIFPDKILVFLSQEKTEIMLGDIDTPGDLETDVSIEVFETIAGGGLAAAALFGLGNSKDFKTNIRRRKFLQAVILAGGVWGLGKIPITTGVLLEPYNKNAIDRIYNRLTAIDSHLHPELSIIFFRNVVMADKLLTVSEDIRKRIGKKARIAFNVGAFHAGIEDFLQAGHDFCRGLILAYPKQYLRSVVNLNNGAKDFSSSHLLKLPENLKAEDVANGEWLNLTKERRVVDEKLEKALTLRLA